MKCRHFQKRIQDLIEGKVQVEELQELIEHVESCNDCYDELEIYYIIHNGLDENDNTSMNFVGQLESNILQFKKKINNFEMARALYAFVNIAAFTAVGGTLIYVFFKYFV